MNNSELLYCKIQELEVNESTAKVTLSGAPVELPKLSFMLLLTLIRHAPSVVTHEQLINEVWKNKVVSDDTISQRIKLLRQALNDNPKDPRYIATIRGQGYQLASPIKDLNVKRNALNNLARLNPILLALLIVISLAGITYLTLSTSPQAAISTALETDSHFNPEIHSINEEARKYYFNGRTYLSRRTENHTKSALAQFEKAVEIDPDYALAYVGIAHSYNEQYEHYQKDAILLEHSIKASRKAIELMPEIFEPYHSLAIAYHKLEQYSEAKRYYRKTLSINSDHLDTLNNLSVLERLDENYEQSLILAFRIIERSPRHSLAYIQIAENYRKTGYYDQAEAWYQKTLNYGPHNRYAQFTLCSLQLKTNKLDAAQQSCSDMVNWDPKDAWGYEWVGELALLRGDIDKAIKHFKKAKELESNYSKFRYASLMLEAAKETDEDLQQYLVESLASMKKFHQEQPDSIGGILNLCNYYAVIGPKEELYYWMNTLLNTQFFDYLDFINSSNYSHLQNDKTFLELVDKIKQKQLKTNQKINKKWVIYPTEFDETFKSSL